MDGTDSFDPATGGAVRAANEAIGSSRAELRAVRVELISVEDESKSRADEAEQLVGGSIRVGLGVDGDSARLDVADTGRGIEPGFLASVFDMFRQASGGPARHEGGLGIGLALVRHLAEQHGGRVAAASAGVGSGACLTVWLPLAATAAEHAMSSNAPALAGLRLLIVDDTADTLDAFATLLQLEGAEVTTASGGKEALARVVDERSVFDLILSDVGMPGMDGCQLVRRLREIESTRLLPIVALTGFGPGADSERVLESGFDAHLTKPVSLDRLLATIEGLRRKPRDRQRRSTGMSVARTGLHQEENSMAETTGNRSTPAGVGGTQPAAPMSPGDEAPPGTPGTGENLCKRCGGTGRLEGGSCTECNGTGKVTSGIGGA